MKTKHIHLGIGHTNQPDYNVTFDDPATATFHFIGILRTLVGFDDDEGNWQEFRAQMMDDFVEDDLEFEYGIVANPYRVLLWSCADTCTKRHTN